VTLEHPNSRPVETLSPSSFEVLRACRTRTAFRQQTPGASQKTPALRLGDACHRVLERIAELVSLSDSELLPRLVELWDEEIAREATISAAAGEQAVFGPPEEWPGYEIKRARLFKVVGRLRESIAGVDIKDLLSEEWLVGRGGRLRGKADLIIRSPGRHEVLDYKSGRGVGQETTDIRASYRRQLQLYAVLEFEASGEWPDKGELIPLEGPPLEVATDPSVCLALADEAMELMRQYNEVVPSAQPANVSPDTCPVCDFSIECRAFWDEFDAGWAQVFIGAVGSIKEIETSSLGGTSLRMKVVGGSVEQPEILIRNIDDLHHPAVKLAKEGLGVYVVGLRRERNRDSFYLPPFGKLSLGTHEYAP
jgi:RecB family exonuclease